MADPDEATRAASRAAPRKRAAIANGRGMGAPLAMVVAEAGPAARSGALMSSPPLERDGDAAEHRTTVAGPQRRCGGGPGDRGLGVGDIGLVGQVTRVQEQ